MYDLYGQRRPHVVLCKLHRTKLDANRAKDEATLGDTTAGFSPFCFFFFCAIMEKLPGKKFQLIARRTQDITIAQMETK